MASMNSYTALVSRILKTPVLVDKIAEWMSDNDALNLVTNDWKKHLENSVLYKSFQEDAEHLYDPSWETNNGRYKVQNIKKDQLSTHVIIAGVCSVHEPFQQSDYNHKAPFAVTIQECDALNMLAGAMTSDVQPGAQLSEVAKLNFQTCSVICQYCLKARESMAANGVNLSESGKQPCIFDIELFNGKALQHCFAQQIKGNLPSKFISIMHVELNTRYFYKSTDNKKVVRLSGQALNMMAFPESNLMTTTPKTSLSNLCLLQVDSKHLPSESKRDLDNDEEEVIDAVPTKKIAMTPSWEDTIDVVEETLIL